MWHNDSMMELLNRSLLVLLLGIFVCTGAGTAQGAEGVFTKNLTVGMRGADVSALQQFLIEGGFLKILAPTGYFGPITRSAVGAWQTSMGILPSAGYFGAISRAKVNAKARQTAIAVIPVQVPVATTTPVAVIINQPVATTTTLIVVTTTQPGGTTTPVAASTRDGSPVRLTIPKINVDAGFQYTGLTSDGVMEIPNNIFDIGWYIGSPRPGEKGASVITGHVAQIRGGVLVKEGVFNNLNTLRVGDTLSVLNDRGESITFVVRESRSYDPAANAPEVFESKDGGAHMNIITCEGIWNPGKLSYSQRLVVFTDAVR